MPHPHCDLRRLAAGLMAAWFFCFISAPPVLAATAPAASQGTRSKPTTLSLSNGQGASKGAAVVIVSSPGVQAPTARKDGDEYPPFLIGPGDVLMIAVYGEAELPLEYQVDSNGIITYPYAGAVKLTGLTPAEASDKLARLLNKPRKVTVLVKESNTYWVSIFGHVGKPGKYQIKGKPTLLSALAEAGGPLPGANLGGAILIHKNVKTQVNLKEYLKGTGPVKPEPYLYPGDVLNVPKSGWPRIGEIAIVASILASAAVLAVQLDNIKRR
jgi:protein involved in polysaccharide export with SLBB domain